MNFYYYTLSLVDLLKSKGSGWATHIVETVQEAEPELSNFRALFFDIDDTLNAHGLGLDEICCKWLNQVSETHSTILLTNCSQKRADQHMRNLKKFQCQAELWDVGKKPNYVWLKSMIEQRGWAVNECAMFGDRPTMDLWCAYQAGFAGRFWVRSWGRKNISNAITEKIKRWEWRQIQGVS